MRAAFIGVVSTGWHCLKSLLDNETNIVGIFTADRQEMVKKSGMHPDYFSEFEDLAVEYSVPLYKIRDTSINLDVEKIKQCKPDIIFCIGWPQVISKDILQIPGQGCIGIHPTLLPERRGGAPINWCLIDGLSRSGVTLFYFDEGLDSGDIIGQQGFEINFEDTAKTVLDKVTGVAVQLVKTYLPLLKEKQAPRVPQDRLRATYTRHRRPEDGIIDWSKTSLSIYNWIRALTSPFPGAFTFWKGNKVIIWESELLDGYRVRFDAKIGEVLDDLEEKGMVVSTGDYCLLIKTLEFDGQIMWGDEFMKKFRIIPGSILGEM